MHYKDRPVIWIHPVTGEYRVPMQNDTPMPQRYRDRGFERREFNSYQEHVAWMKSKGLINHAAEGIPVHEDAQKNRWGY